MSAVKLELPIEEDDGLSLANCYFAPSSRAFSGF